MNWSRSTPKRRVLVVVALSAALLGIAGVIWEYLGYVQFCQSPPQGIETTLMVLFAIMVLTSVLLTRMTLKARESAQERTREPVGR